jgi:RNA polymerase subunit RPABC4/transcription elongation factor Spt4
LVVGAAFGIYGFLQTESNYQTSIIAGGWIVAVAGAVLIGIGAIMKEPKLESIFCRYCGRKTISGEYCSACQKSAQSKSVNMKICRNCSSAMSDDSIYCANCGKGFQ